MTAISVLGIFYKDGSFEPLDEYREICCQMQRMAKRYSTFCALVKGNNDKENDDILHPRKQLLLNGHLSKREWIEYIIDVNLTYLTNEEIEHIIVISMHIPKQVFTGDKTDDMLKKMIIGDKYESYSEPKPQSGYIVSFCDNAYCGVDE